MFTSQSYDSIESGATAPPELAKLILHEQGNTAVSARELHRFVESSERFSKWIDRMFEYGFTNGVDYTPYKKVHPLNKQAFGDYALTLDTAKEIAMVQRNEKGRQARRFFIECEKKLRALAQNSQTGLIQLVNTLTEKVIGLERRIDQIAKGQAAYFTAQKTANQTAEAIEDRVKRERIITFVRTTIHRSLGASWSSFWDKFDLSYNADIRGLEKRKNELTIDTAIRHGYLNQLWEFVNIQ